MQMVQHDGKTLGVGELIEGDGEPAQVLILDDSLARRGLLGPQEVAQPQRRGLQSGFEGALARGVTLVSAEGTDGVGQVVDHNLPQPGGQFRVAGAAELVTFLVSLQQRLLHDIGRIDTAAQVRVEV
jgi:hypothetical protein